MKVKTLVFDAKTGKSQIIEREVDDRKIINNSNETNEAITLDLKSLKMLIDTVLSNAQQQQQG